jgi:hypothetical protein
MSLKANGQNAHLSTVGGIDPGRALEKFDSDPVVIILIAIWASDGQTGLLGEKGAWIEELWRIVLVRFPDVQGCRLLWNTIFFAVPSADASSVKEEFRKILRMLLRPSLESLCLLAEAHGSPTDRLSILNSMQDETAAPGNFGTDERFRHRLKDAEDWGNE